MNDLHDSTRPPLPPYPQAYPWVDVARHALIEAGRPDLAKGMVGRDIPACSLFSRPVPLPKDDRALVLKAMFLAHMSDGHDVELADSNLHCETCLPRRRR